LSVAGFTPGKSLEITEDRAYALNSHEGESRVPYRLIPISPQGPLLQIIVLDIKVNDSEFY
jgi:hypothetical protein